MPASFRILPKHGLVYVRLYGHIWPAESLEAFRNYLRHPDFRPGQKQLIDMGYHIAVTDLSFDGALDELATLPDQGVTSYKLFMSYKRQIMVDDETLFRTMQLAAPGPECGCTTVANQSRQVIRLRATFRGSVIGSASLPPAGRLRPEGAMVTLARPAGAVRPGAGPGGPVGGGGKERFSRGARPQTTAGARITGAVPGGPPANTAIR